MLAGRPAACRHPPWVRAILSGCRPPGSHPRRVVLTIAVIPTVTVKV